MIDSDGDGILEPFDVIVDYKFSALPFAPGTAGFLTLHESLSTLPSGDGRADMFNIPLTMPDGMGGEIPLSDTRLKYLLWHEIAGHWTGIYDTYGTSSSLDPDTGFVDNMNTMGAQNVFFFYNSQRQFMLDYFDGTDITAVFGQEPGEPDVNGVERTDPGDSLIVQDGYSHEYTPVPEPSAWALLVLGAAMIMRRKTRAA